MSMLTKSIDRYVDELLATGDDVVHAEVADTFISMHGDVIGFHVEEIVRRAITQAIKKRAQTPAPPLGQGVLFRGLPAAVTISDGITRPIARCTRADLAAGRDMKVENISAAQAALKAYDYDIARIDPLLTSDDTTVGQIAHLLSETA